VLDPSLLYELRSTGDLGSPVLIEALDGFVDAGQGVRLARSHLLESFGSEVVATFEVDELLDYRSRRPLLVFDTDHWESYDRPEIALHAVRDANGTTFVLLTGPEPDTQWERFVAAVLLVVESLGVRLTIGLHAVPWAAPHTRPLGVSAHGRAGELPIPPPVGIGRVQVPGSAGHLLQYRLAEVGRDVAGVVAHVPHYLALAEYPDAAAALLGGVEQVAGLSLALEALRAAGAAVRAEVDAQVSTDEETSAAIRALEERHDALLGEERTPGEALPTGEELGQAFERFLAEHSRENRDDDQLSL
jgi:hypothetical protein